MIICKANIELPRPNSSFSLGHISQKLRSPGLWAVVDLKWVCAESEVYDSTNPLLQSLKGDSPNCISKGFF